MNFQLSKLEFLKIGILFSLLSIVFLIPFLSMKNFSPVVDEIVHLPSGYSYLKTGEIKLNSQHPPLIKMLAALPLLFLDLKFDPNDFKLINSQAEEWQFGRYFLFNNNIDRTIFWGRIPIIFLSVLLGWYVYKWGKELFGTAETQNKEEARKGGEAVGLTALFLYAFMPNIIAHSQFVTTDLGLTTFSFIALYHLWKLVRSGINSKRYYLIGSGIFLGLALGSKFSAVFLLPIFFILIFFYVHKKYTGLSRLSKINLFLKITLPIYGLAFLVIWGLYFFTSDLLFYWKGLKTVYADSNIGYPYYLNGDFRPGGWWYYFLWAFIIKTPIPFLVVLIGSLFYYKKQNLGFLNSLFVFLPVALFLFIASWKAHNIGVRYILPIYPFLILFVSGQIIEITQKLKCKTQNNNLNFKRLFLIFSFTLYALSVWYVFSSLSVYPDYLAYFNELIGGPNNGYKYLDDSNIDWGQDLKRLAKYQEQNPDLQVAYVWDSYVNAARLYDIKNILPLDSQELWLSPNGKYAISTHAVVRTKLASQLNKNDKMNWMDNYKPIDRIGQSFFIYEFP